MTARNATGELFAPEYPPAYPEGFSHHSRILDLPAQAALVRAVADALPATPFFQPRMPRTGTPTSVVMLNFGPLGWVSSRREGYRYQPLHPDTREPWRPIPRIMLDLWERLTDWPAPPECCLVNWYRPSRAARMGPHVDRDEAAADAPILGVSLGDTATFRLGNLARGGRTIPVELRSGDAVVMAGPSRRRHHAVSRVAYGTSALLPEGHFPGGGRLNLTLRRVTPL